VKSPVVFQDLEDELAPVARHLTGKVLNAGCGDRNLAAFLKANGATEVDNCDRRSSIPNAIVCDLVEVPVESDTYDSILCNAVLEHVQFPDRVMAELRRLLKPGGTMVVCIPFLQAYHPSPDYRRYSREGMLELARTHNLDVVDILPVHSLAQTVTWIAWTYLGERKNRVAQACLWLPFYAWNRLSSKTDFTVREQANGYQMVLKKSS
jgi:SAM-dependent methyltransferase